MTQLIRDPHPRFAFDNYGVLDHIAELSGNLVVDGGSRAYQLNRPINACWLNYQINWKLEQLLTNWQLPREFSQGHPDDRRLGQGIINCTVSISGIHRDFCRENFMGRLLTLNGQLPIGHHEVLAYQVPTRDGQLASGEIRGWSYIRWSTPDLARQCKELIRSRSWTTATGELMRIRCGNPDTPFRIDNEFNRQPRVGQINMYKWVWWHIAPDCHF